MSKHTPTPWPSSDAPIADLLRAVACVNAFHSEDGRELPTEKIEPGLFWEMRDMLDFIARTASQSVRDARYGPDADWQLAGPTMGKLRALLAKLESQE